ncbi:MAG: hypothetical protein IJ437_03960 [Clostridia bacterium]|nr:hypothetical protein [Clostridia bacterium]
MKNRILAALLAVLLVGALLVPMAVGASTVDHMSDTFANAEEKLATMTYIMTSDDPDKEGEGDGILQLYVDNKSGEMAIKNKVTGEITLSNPYNVSDVFPATNTADKGYRLSQVYVNYFKITSGKDAMSTLYSYNDCFAYNQGKISKTSEGIRVDYSIGEERRDYAVPLKIALEDFYKAMSEGGQSSTQIEKLVKENFNIYDPDQVYIENKLLSNPSLTLRQEMINEHPICLETPFIFLKPGIYASSYSMEVLEAKLIAANPEYFVLSEKDEDGKPIGEKTQFEIDSEELWDEAKDRENYVEKEYPNFKFTVDYKLANDGLIVNLDASTVEYDKSLYCLANITILPYFASAALDSDLDENGNKQYDNGYIFIPDGSGTIVRFEDLIAKKQTGKLTSSLYGSDYAYYQITNKNTEPYTMPVFGMVNTSGEYDKGYFAIIEDGDALASITANAERYHISAYASFNYAEYDTYDLADAFSGGASSSTKITVVTDNYYEGDYRIYYKLLTDDKYGFENTYDTSYVGMAKLYRDYLTENGSLKKITDVEENTKLFLEVFGSIKVKEQMFSFPVTVDKELTTFSDIIEMQEELSKAGIYNNSFILKGFYNGGLASTYPTEIKWQKVLGGKDGLSDLLDDADKNNYDVAIDVDFSYSYATKWFSDYSNSKHAVKTLDDRYTTKRVYYAATQTFERTSGVAVSSASFITLFESFTDSIEGTKIKTLATRALGSDLNSDFDVDNYFSREDSKDETVEFMKLATKLGEERFDLIVDTGNAYSVPYASGVLSAPLDSSKYIKASESVPFYGMVYHGSVEFAGNALNMEGDEDYMLLKAIENGATLYYTLAKQNVEELKFDSDYNKYYSVSYDFLKNSIVENYTIYNNAMKDKQDKYIEDHRFLNDEDEDCAVTYLDGTKTNNSLVVLVVYEGGEGFILNYNSQDVIVEFGGEPIVVPALGFEEYSVKEAGVK